MSLQIIEKDIERVLLIDGWHNVIKDTFFLDAYEFFSDEPIVGDSGGTRTHGGGQSGICPTGFSFVTSTGGVFTQKNGKKITPKSVISGPLTAILAVERTIKEEIK